MKVKIEISLEHPIMFLSDPYANEQLSPDAGDLFIASTNNSVAFRVRPYFDGGATITVSSERPSVSKPPEFTGSIASDSRVLSISDSYRFNYCMIPIHDCKADIEIWRNLEVEDDIWIRIYKVTEY